VSKRESMESYFGLPDKCSVKMVELPTGNATIVFGDLVVTSPSAHLSVEGMKAMVKKLTPNERQAQIEKAIK